MFISLTPPALFFEHAPQYPMGPDAALQPAKRSHIFAQQSSLSVQNPLHTRRDLPELGEMDSALEAAQRIEFRSDPISIDRNSRVFPLSTTDGNLGENSSAPVNMAKAVISSL